MSHWASKSNPDKLCTIFFRESILNHVLRQCIDGVLEIDMEESVLTGMLKKIVLKSGVKALHIYRPWEKASFVVSLRHRDRNGFKIMHGSTGEPKQRKRLKRYTFTTDKNHVHPSRANCLTSSHLIIHYYRIYLLTIPISSGSVNAILAIISAIPRIAYSLRN